MIPSCSRQLERRRRRVVVQSMLNSYPGFSVGKWLVLRAKRDEFVLFKDLCGVGSL
jgi:hypothetical protein